MIQFITKSERIHFLNRAQIIDDAHHLSRATVIPYSYYFSLLEYLLMEDHVTPWNTAIDGLSAIANGIRRYPTEHLKFNVRRRIRRFSGFDMNFTFISHRNTWRNLRESCTENCRKTRLVTSRQKSVGKNYWRGRVNRKIRNARNRRYSSSKHGPVDTSESRGNDKCKCLDNIRMPFYWQTVKILKN